MPFVKTAGSRHAIGQDEEAEQRINIVHFDKAGVPSA
jgi:hypothetical protein